MTLFASDEQIADAERDAADAIAQAGHSTLGQARSLTQLAWYLRQRDPQRSLQVCGQAEARLASASASSSASTHANSSASDHRPEALRLASRQQLVRAEQLWLNAELDAAQALVDAALAGFLQLDDARGAGDALWAAYSIASQRGDFALVGQIEPQAAAHYARAADPVRIKVLALRHVQTLAYLDIRGAERRLSSSGIDPAAESDRVVLAWLEGARAILHERRGDIALALAPNMRAYAHCVASNQWRLAILTAISTGAQFHSLNDLEASLEWHERALALARRMGWRTTLGASLAQTGETLQSSGRRDAAMQMIRQAMPLLAEGSFNMANARMCMGRALAWRGDDVEAATWFESALQHYSVLGSQVSGLEAELGLAQSLSRVGRHQAARQHADNVLARTLAHGLRHHQVRALEHLADMRRRDPGDWGPGAPTVQQLLEQALQTARSITGYRMLPELLEALAAEHASQGAPASAYALALEAGRARDQNRSLQVSERAVALQVRHDTENLKLEADHLRVLGQSQAQRAAELAQANATLETLSQVGRDITAHLDAAAVAQSMRGHVRRLLDVPTLLIARMDQAGAALVFAVGDDGDAVLSLSQAQPAMARCAQDRREGVCEHPQSSQLSAPLMVGARLLGVASVASRGTRRYTERDLAVFRALCAYGAIALENSDAQAQLRAQNAQLSQAMADSQKSSAAKMRFLAAASHELRTPLNGMVGMAQMLQGDEPVASDAQRRRLDVLLRSAMHLRSLVNDLIDVVRLDSGRIELRPEAMRPDELVHEVVDLLTPLAQAKGLALSLVLAPDLPAAVHADPVRLRQMLYNLVGNAVKFTLQGRVELRAEATPVGLRLVVTDTGPGIAAHLTEAAFRPFEQVGTEAEARNGGSGLGLTITRQLAREMGGDARCSSVLGQGSRFEVEITAPRCAPPAAAVDSPPQAPAPTSARHVLVADDNEVNQLVTQGMLERMGLVVDLAADGEEALLCMANQRYDAVLMDCLMPRLNGFDATRRWRERERALGHGHLPIIALTATSMAGDRENCLAAGMDDYLAKPFLRDELHAILGRVGIRGDGGNPAADAGPALGR